MKTKYQECKCENEKDFDHYKHVWREHHELGLHGLSMWWCAFCNGRLEVLESNISSVPGL